MTNGRSERNATLIQNPGVPLTSTVLLSLFAGANSDAGVQVNTGAVLGIPAAYRAIALLAGTVGSLELRAYTTGTNKQVGMEAESEDTGLAPAILEQPHPLYTSHEFWELAMVHELTRGNFYALKVRDGAKGSAVQRLFPLDPTCVNPKWVVKDGKAFPTDKLFVITPPDGSAPYGLTSDDIFHVPAMGYDGLKGLAPIDLFKQSYGLGIAAEKTAAKFFGGGALQSGFIHADKKLTETQAKSLKERWQAKMGGVAHAGEVAILDAGAKFESMMVPPDQAQFLQTREFQVLEVARIFGLPPHLLMATGATSNWGTGIEQMNIGLVLFCLKTWTSRFEARITRELMPAKQFARFQAGELLKGDTRTRYAAHLLARRGHWESINEIRAAEGLPPIADPRADDVFYGEGETGGGVGGDVGLSDPTLPGGNLGAEPPPGDAEGQGDGTGDGTTVNSNAERLDGVEARLEAVEAASRAGRRRKS